MLRGRGRWVKHLALAVAIRRVHAVEKNGVKMRIEPQITVGALDDGHGAGLAGRQAALDVPPFVPGGDCVRENAHHLTKQFPVEGEGEAQRERHGQHELTDGHVRQDVIHEVQRALVHSSAKAAWAHCPGLAAEGDNVVLAAVVAIKVREASRKNPAVEKLVQLLRHKLRQRAPAGLVGPLLLEGQQVLLQHLVKRGLLRLPA